MKIQIDDLEIAAFSEDTIMDAAKRAGIFIPGLCCSDAVEKSGCCRLCMVEVEERGRKRLVAACAFRVKDGMKIATGTERVARVRKTMLHLLYIQAPDNPAVMELMKRYRVSPHPRLPLKADSSHCILCRLCTANCQALGKAAISPVDRGISKRIDTPYGRPSDDCIGCASCADVCPTGCIEVVDTEDKRVIWNKEFSWIRCQRCGKIITTQEHFAASTEPGIPALCPSCRRKAQADVFAETFGR